ncbi:MAG: hypothetical protein KDB00_10550 [Planctomycetales bacterium]|nr:hypothetical protein [Planctomycetales bacterium]
MDEHSTAVVAAVSRLPKKENYQHADVVSILDEDFNVGITLIRLVLAMSKDEFGLQMSQQLGGTGGVGVSRYRNEQGAFLKALDCLGFRDALAVLVNRPVDWKDILCERLRFGRGSAIKGQKRGRELENTTEEIVVRVFGKGGFDTRCRFVGSDETQTEKADFAIPTKSAPRILIECKAYGATGSKQTDILGDIERVVIKKRSDTHLLLVTDGISWTLRQNDLRKLIDWQNSGRITRIYTQRMAADLENDLIQLKREHSL